MAPSSRDDQQDDKVSRQPDSAGSGEPEQGGDSSRSPGPVDFGEFVSRSVRSSADRFRTKGASGEAPDDEVPPKTPRPKRPTPRSGSDVPRQERPARYWRDSLQERASGDSSGQTPGSRRFLGNDEDVASEEQEESTGFGGGGLGALWSQLTGDGDGEGPNRSLIAYFLLGLILMLLIIFLLSRMIGGGDDTEEEPTVTPAPTTIVQPGAGTDGTPTVNETPADTDVAQPTETPEIRRGGDNVLGDDRGTPESRTDGEGALATQLTPAVESPLAKECSDRCLVRVESDKLQDVLDQTGNRPSFAVNDLAWLVATPTGISLLDERADVELVEDDSETLKLYVIEVPEDEDPGLVTEYADILDETGQFRLVRFDEIPARVATLSNEGYDVTKVAPATPEQPLARQDRTALEDVSAGELMGQVSDANVVDIITTLQASGSTDGTGIGSRYYTYGGNQIAADYLYQQLESFGVDVWFEEFLTAEGILLVNVVGEVPGKDDSAMYAVMAHLDSINVEGSPATAPGADDNSTGMAATLEMARILSRYELEHPVQFVFVNAEEVGILGSSAWAKRANAENIAVAGVFNIDSVGSDRRGRLMIFHSNNGSEWMQDVMMSVNRDYGLNQDIEPHTNSEIVADDNMVREQGIDAVMIARELYEQSPVHHTARDLEDKVSIDNVLTTTYMVLLSIVRVAGP